MTMITPSYLGETIEYSSLHACRSTLEDPTQVAREGHHKARTASNVPPLLFESASQRHRWRSTALGSTPAEGAASYLLRLDRSARTESIDRASRSFDRDRRHRFSHPIELFVAEQAPEL